MEFEFDKEIDAMLRRARGDEAIISLDSHPDADEIAAYAENAVSESAGKRFTAHLADCTRCRKILSQTILLNAEAEAADDSSAAEEVAGTAQGKSAPWYRRFFAFPQAAYAMGALVLLFSGFFAYLILQNASGEAEVSRSTETAARNEAPAAPQFATPAASNANTTANIAAPSSNSSAGTNTNAASTTAGAAPALSASNTNASSATPLPPAKTVAPEDDASSADASVMSTPQPKPVMRDEDKNLAKAAPAPSNQPSAAAGAAVNEQSRRDKEESFQTDGVAREDNSGNKLRTNRAASQEKAKKQESPAGERRSVGGKTFNNVGGIWFDAAYTNQKQKTVNRGSNDYQKLDAGLRSIADQLGGAIVVLWKGKAYRIQ